MDHHGMAIRQLEMNENIKGNMLLGQNEGSMNMPLFDKDHEC